VQLEEGERERAHEAAKALPSWWTAWRRWRWVVPVPVAAALAVTIYVAMRPASVSDLGPAASVVARHEADATAPAPEIAARQVEKAATPLLAEPAPAPAASAASREVPAVRLASPASAGAEAPATPTVASGEMPERRGEQRASVEAPVPSAAQSAPASEALAAREGVAPAPPSAPASASGRVMAGAPTTLAALTDAGQPVAPVIVATPDPAAFWRVNADGGLARSHDGGDTWQVVARPTPHRLVAGSCPGVSTCWFVGVRGTVVRTTDGVTWAPLAAPVGDDLVGVEASTADTATIRTSTAIYATTDGGRTWRPVDR